MWPPCRPVGPTKNRPERILAGHTCPRPFSYLFYVASKPAGSNDHGIDGVILSDRLPVKAPVGVDRRLYVAPKGERATHQRDRGHSARSSDRTACEEGRDS